MSVELIRNIKALIKIQLKQNKNAFMIFIGIIGAITFDSNLNLIFDKNVNSSLFTNVGGSGPFLIIGFCMLFAIMSINILTNQNISMYPGTSISRFISRILSDNIMILAIIIFTFLLYCIEYPILLAIKGGGADISTIFSFDIEYAFISMIYVLSYYLMAYGIFVFIYALATKLGVKKTIISYTGFLGLFVMLIKYNIISLFGIFDYFRDEKSIGIFVLKTWSIWIFTLLLAFLIAKSFKIMKEESSNAKLIMLPVGFVIIMIFAFSIRSNVGATSESYTAVSKFQQLKETDIYKETLVKCDNPNYKNLLTSNSNISFMPMSQTEAYNAGILENNNFLKDEVLVVIFFPDGKCKNQYLYQYYLDNMTITCDDSMLDVRFPKTKTILNFLWGDSYKFLDGYDINKDDSITSSGMARATGFVIAPDSVFQK